MPCDTPGTPSGNTGLRSPGSFFLVLNRSLAPANHSVGSRASPTLPQPASGSASTEARRMMSVARFIVPPSTCAAGRDERDQHVDARARSGWRLEVGGDHVGPALGSGCVAGAPSGERQQFAREVAIRTALGGQRFQPRARRIEGALIDQEGAGAQGGDILQRDAGRTILGNLLIGGDGVLRIALGDLGGLAHSGKVAVVG